MTVSRLPPDHKNAVIASKDGLRLTCTELNHQPEVIASLIPFVELDHIRVMNFMSQTHKVCDVGTLRFVDAMNGHKVDRSFATTFVYN